MTVSKESGGGGDVVLEAGALVLSDQGTVRGLSFFSLGRSPMLILVRVSQEFAALTSSIRLDVIVIVYSRQWNSSRCQLPSRVSSQASQRGAPCWRRLIRSGKRVCSPAV